MIFSYRNYVEDTVRNYNLRIKSVVPLTDAHMDALEGWLRRYDLKDVDGPHRTIMQNHPLDFHQVAHSEVYIVDVTLGVPISPFILTNEIKQLLLIPEAYLVVRSEYDPLELENRAIAEQDRIREEAAKQDLTVEPLLSRHIEEPITEEVPLYGNEYNNKLLKYLAHVANTRQVEDVHVDAYTAELFDFLKPPSNDAYKDLDKVEDVVTRPYPRWSATDDPPVVRPPYLDNRLNDQRHIYRRYWDEKKNKPKEFELDWEAKDDKAKVA